MYHIGMTEIDPIEEKLIEEYMKASGKYQAIVIDMRILESMWPHYSLCREIRERYKAMVAKGNALEKLLTYKASKRTK